MSKMSNNNLKEYYQKKVVPQLVKELGLINSMAAPRLRKVVINAGIGEGSKDKGAIKEPLELLTKITGQKPKIAQARKSEAGFQLRAGAPIGLVVTLRRQRMFDFLEKLFKIVLPRVRDFQGVPLKSFDGRGNYSLGIPEYNVFPELDQAKIEKNWGMQITLVTNAGRDKEARKLLELMGMPFEKIEGKENK